MSMGQVRTAYIWNQATAGEKTGMSSEADLIQEKLLVMRAQAREAGAFQELVTRDERQMLYYIHRLLGIEVDREDVLQEVWIRVFLKINTLRAPEAFRVGCTRSRMMSRRAA